MTAILFGGALLVVLLVAGATWAYYSHQRAVLIQHQQHQHALVQAARTSAGWEVDAVPTDPGDQLEIRLQRFARLPWGLEREGPPLLVGVINQHDPDYEIKLARLTGDARQRAAGLNMLRDDPTLPPL